MTESVAGKIVDFLNAEEQAYPVLCRMKSYIQPFERELALWELRTLAKNEPRETDSPIIFEVVSSLSARELADQLAYWESIRDNRTFQSFTPQQIFREATTYITKEIGEIMNLDPIQREWRLELKLAGTIPNRRCLRYGSHGMHEYRGKFFPQLVRSLINAADVPINGLVADPMSGSGTTVVEAILAQRSGIGLDMNPLSVFMGQVKCEVLSIPADELFSALPKLQDALKQPHNVSTSYFSSLPENDQEYLNGWFSQDVLSQLDVIQAAISQFEDQRMRDVLRLCLSNIIRAVSWQKDDDLRVRKIVEIDTRHDVATAFFREVDRSFCSLMAFNSRNSDYPLGTFSIKEGDARHTSEEWKEYRGQVDAVITSPPYATALPYLDTDRLSLCYLGLLPRDAHRRRDLLMIGNREIGDKERRRSWEEYLTRRHELPGSVSTLIERIYYLNEGADSEAGFRRRNLPALLWGYFASMKSVLSGVSEVLKPGGLAYFIVGDNHTTAGGEKVIINTPSLLSDLAHMVGLEVESPLSMELLVSRDIFRQNRGSSEWVLPFRRPAN